MKKILSIIALLFVLVAATPKVANATGEPCHVVNMCDNYVVVCDAYDYVTWDEIYCPPDDN
jgi:hypothetical protein